MVTENTKISARHSINEAENDSANSVNAAENDWTNWQFSDSRALDYSVSRNTCRRTTQWKVLTIWSSRRDFSCVLAVSKDTSWDSREVTLALSCVSRSSFSIFSLLRAVSSSCFCKENTIINLRGMDSLSKEITLTWNFIDLNTDGSLNMADLNSLLSPW